MSVGVRVLVGVGVSVTVGERVGVNVTAPVGLPSLRVGVAVGSSPYTIIRSKNAKTTAMIRPIRKMMIRGKYGRFTPSQDNNRLAFMPHFV